MITETETMTFTPVSNIALLLSLVLAGSTVALQHPLEPRVRNGGPLPQQAPSLRGLPTGTPFQQRTDGAVLPEADAVSGPGTQRTFTFPGCLCRISTRVI